MDAAEAKIDTQEEVIHEVSTPETEAPTEDVQETIAVKDALEEPSEKPKKGRDASGKFTKQKAADPKTEASEESPADASAEDQASGQNAVNEEDGPVVKSEDQESEALGTEFPIYWPAELKEAVAKSPPEVQKTLVAYEAQRTEWANRIANESQRGKAIEKRAGEVFEPYKLKLQSQGIQDPFEAAQRLLAWNEIFEKDPKAALSDLMRKNGLTPNDFFEDDRQPQSQYQEQLSPEELRAAAREEAKKEFQAFQEQQQTQALQTEIESFKNGKDSFGHVRRQFAELHAKPISDAFETILSQYPRMPRTEALNHAYEFVQKEVRGMYGIPAKPVAPTAPKPDASRAKAVASSATGAPASGTVAKRPSAKTVEEAMDRAEERMGIR